MKTVYFVRHGESEANAGFATFQGETSQLTEKGRQQAHFIAKRCAKLSFDVLIASPAVRAQETATYISELTGKIIETVSLFTERILPSDLLGQPRNDPRANKRYESWEHGFFERSIQTGDGENFSSLKKRALDVLEYLAGRKESQILVVAHGFLLRMIIACIVFGEELTIEEFTRILQSFRTNNTGLTVIEYKPKHGGTPGLSPPKWLVRVWNDHAHLG